YTFFFSSRRRHTRSTRDWSSDVCSSDLEELVRVHLPDPEPEFLVVGAEVHLVGARELGRHAEAPRLLAGERRRKIGERDDAVREIGRASCREREYITGVGGTIKRTEERE